MLRTMDEVIKEFGGPAEIAALLGRRPNAVSMWKSRGNFPRDTVLVMQDALRVKGCAAPAHLWGIPAPQSSTHQRASA